MLIPKESNYNVKVVMHMEIFQPFYAFKDVSMSPRQWNTHGLERSRSVKTINLLRWMQDIGNCTHCRIILKKDL